MYYFIIIVIENITYNICVMLSNYNTQIKQHKAEITNGVKFFLERFGNEQSDVIIDGYEMKWHFYINMLLMYFGYSFV